MASKEIKCERTAYCIDLANALVRQTDSTTKTKREVRHPAAAQEQLTTLVNILANSESKLNESSLERVEAVLHECLTVFGSVSNRPTIFSKTKRKMKRVEHELLKVNTSLITAVALSIGRQRHGTLNEDVVVAKNPDANFQPFFPKVLKAPDMVEGVKVSNGDDTGSVNISWTRNFTDIVDCYQIMKDNSNDLFPNVSGYCDSVKFYYDPIRNFRPFNKYTIKVRAVNSAGQSEWSDGFIVQIRKAPPNRPPAPKLVTLYRSSTRTHLPLCDVDSVRLAVPFPNEDDLNTLPLEKIIVQYSNQSSTEPSFHVIHKFHPNEDGHIIAEIPKLDLQKSKYSFAVLWCNSAGESQPSAYIEVSRENAIPSSPKVRDPSNKTSNSVKVRWMRPESNAFAIVKYEVQKLNSYGIFEKCVESTSYSATVRHLEQRKRYVFRVCAVTVFGTRGNYSTPITIKTRLSKVVRETLGGMAGIAGFGIGALIAPIAGPFLGAGAAIGLGVRSTKLIKNKAGKVALGTSVVLVSVVPLTAMGTLVSPVAVPVCTGHIARDLVIGKLNRNPQFSSDQSSSSDEAEEIIKAEF